MKGLGQNFDDFMKEQGLYEEAKALAAKKAKELVAAQKSVSINPSPRQSSSPTPIAAAKA
jgi:hypothetical protein